MLAWWNGLSFASQVFACAAIPATVIMVLQAIFLLAGMGDNSDSDLGGDMDADGGDFDMESDADADMDADADAGGQGDGLALFTVRGIVAFFSVGGWVGLVADCGGFPLIACVMLSVVSGTAALIGIAWIMKGVRKLQESGNLDLRETIGKTGTAYFPIPPKGEGKGKVHVTMASGLLEIDAVNTGREAIPTGGAVLICALCDSGTVVVAPFGKPESRGNPLIQGAAEKKIEGGR